MQGVLTTETASLLSGGRKKSRRACGYQPRAGLAAEGSQRLFEAEEGVRGVATVVEERDPPFFVQ
jgi:hypothetical protein